MLTGSNASDSDSDKTVDSDELMEFISRPSSSRMKAKDTPVQGKRKRTTPVRRAEHDLSDSDSDKEILKDPENKRVTERTSKSSSSPDRRPLCKFGRTCYRKSPLHLKQFRHNEDDSSSASTSVNTLTTESSSSIKRQKSDSSIDGSSSSNCNAQHLETDTIGFFVTKVSGIPQKFNEGIAVGIKDILSPLVGKLKASAQFNYMIDVPWLMEQYPTEFRSCPLLLVHGEQRDSKRALQKSASPFGNITLCQANLPIMYGTHHTKMMLLQYETGLRVIVHTSNLISSDWHQKTQGAWLSPIFPTLKNKSSDGESLTRFKTDLLDYINSYNCEELNEWCRIIKSHDFSSARVFLIGSVPGRHIGTRKTMFGHLKLRKVFTSYGPEKEKLSKSYIIGQFSSIGSLGANGDQWLCGEWLTSLAAVKDCSIQSARGVPLQLIFPSVENVRKSLEGYPAGANLPYSKNVAVKQTYLNSFFYQWKADITGRSPASPHIKTYLRISNENKVMWFLVTSANLSKAAWGMLEKQGTQLMIRSYELGVLFLPQHFGSKDAFSLSRSKKPGQYIVLPYDIPLTKYSPKDEPWTWDAPHTYAPDRNGNMWQPS